MKGEKQNMNKFLQKVAKLFLGISMAAGVGVAIGSNKKASSVEATDLNVTMSTYASSAGWKTDGSTKYTSANLDANVTASLSGSSNTGKFYTNEWRLYQTESASITISVSNGTMSKVTFIYNVSNGGRLYDGSTGYTSGTAITVSNLASKTWTVGSSTGKTNGQVKITAIAVTYTATQSKYNINYYDQGGGAFSGTHASGYPTQHTYGTATTLKTATKTGYTFGGWFTTSECTGSAVTSLGATAYTAAINLYAKWTATTYSISYTLDGGTHGNTHPTSGTYDTVFSVSAPTKTGYTFTGWTVTSGLNTSTAKWGTTSSPSTAISSSSTKCVNGTNAVYFKNINAASTAVTLTANWSINSYTVGGTISDGHLSSTADVDYNDPLSITIVPDQDFTYPSSIDSVTMGGAAYAGYTYDSTDGSFSIEHVTGNVVINAACVSTSATERFFDYDLTNCSIENAPESMYDTEMKVLQIVADDHYKFPSSITVTGISAEKWEYDADEGTILINEPDGDINITVTCVAKAQNIITIGTLTGVTQKSGDPTTVEEGDIVTLTFIVSSGYGLPTSSGVTVTGVDSQSWSWDQNSGELEILGGTSNITVSVVAMQRDLTNVSLELGTKKTSYTTGDDFELPSTVTANFNIAPLTVNVKNDVEVSGPVVLNNDKYIVTGSGTVTLTYTYEPTEKTQTASYAITATPITPSNAKYVKVTSSSNLTTGQYLIVCEESNVAFDGSLTAFSTGNNVSVDISNGEIAHSATTAAIEFTIDVASKTIYSSSGYYINNTANSNAMNYTTTSASNTSFGITDGNFVAIGSGGSYLRYNSSSGQECFKYFKSSTYTGQKAVQLYKYQQGTSKELKWITATVNSGTYYQGSTVESSNFTVTAHYNGGNPQSEVVAENITVTNGYLANIGNNQVTLTYGGKSYNVNVVAVEQTAEYTGLSWTQGEYTIIDGQNIDFSKFGTVTAEYDDGEAYATKAISLCTVATYTKSGDVYTKVADLSNGATITSSSHGKYLGVTYTETNTFTAYSSAPIYVVESIEDVFVQEKTYTWTKVSSIAVGDTVLLTGTKADGTAPHELSGVTSNSGTIASFSTNPAGTYRLTVVAGASSGSFAFKDADNNYLYHNGTDKTLSLSDELTDASSWTVEFDSETPTKATVTNVDSGNPLQYNPGNYFRVYASASQQPIQFYKGESSLTPTGDSIANTNVAVQKAVLEFAAHFNETMACVNGGTTSNVSGKWTTLSGDFTSALSEFTGDDLKHFKDLFANAYSAEGGDTLQDMLARYDYIVAKYKLSDFLKTAAGRAEVAQSPRVSPLINIIGENTNTVAIIVIISMVSVTAIGGYFFLRKRKENN